ncbi:MAG TPA: hypothetical protein VF519_05430 [Mycobacteriales bacterium]|jgi:hypothetical protein
MSPLSLPRRAALGAVAAALALPAVASADCRTDASYCVDNEVVSISVVTRGGTVEVYRDGFSIADQYVFCAPEYVNWLLKPEVNWEAYDDCATEPHRVL